MINSNKNQTKAIRGRERTCDREIKKNSTKIYQSKVETLKNNTETYQSIWVHLSSFGFTLVQSNSFGPFNPIWSTSVVLVHFIPLWSILVHSSSFGKGIMTSFYCDGVGIRVFFGGAALVAFQNATLRFFEAAFL